MSINIPKNEVEKYKRPGVYLLLDLDDQFLYAGRSGNIRQRLDNHFIAHNSSIITDGTIDLFEISKVFVWFVESREETKQKEEELIAIFQPRMNLATRDQQRIGELPSVEQQKEILGRANKILDIEWPSGIDRKNSFARAKRKAAHLALILEKIELSQKRTQKMRTQLALHLEDLNTLIERILQTMEE
ncbi:MAG: GIY-YIG nuclease family protein [Candidatus Heimdallarchaeota archaeon]